MGKCSLSERVKQINRSRTKEVKLREAVQAYHLELAKPLDASPRKGARVIAAEHGIPKQWRTVIYRADGRQSVGEAHETQQNLTDAEESILVEFLRESAERGFPQRIRDVEDLANMLRQQRLGAECAPVGVAWAERFLARHYDELQTHWSKPLDTQRARSMTPEAKQKWFELIEKFVVKCGIRPEDLYAMDETGAPPSDAGTSRVIGARGVKTQHQQGGANRENVTAVVTICADGSVLHPTIIFKAKNFQKKWRDNNVSGASFAHSPNGWTDRELALNWMVKDFDASTREKAGGRTRVLLMDGHNSHYSYQLLEYARANNICILGYPPHCTHVLQGLDVVCFAKFKTEFHTEIRSFENQEKRPLGKGDYTNVFGKAFLRSFTPDTVKAAFEATGVCPFNPDRIPARAVKPSLATSTKSGFMLEQASPVKAVLNALASRPPTAFELSPCTHQPLHYSPPATSYCPTHVHDENIDPALREPDTPERTPSSARHRTDNVGELPHGPTGRSPSSSRRRLDDIDDPMETPSKRVRILYSSLASTSRGSLLLSKAPLTSTYTIIKPVTESIPAELTGPDFSLLDKRPPYGYQTRPALEADIASLREQLARARNIIRAHEHLEEHHNAQMIVQNLELIKLKESLHALEARKKTDRTKLFPGGLGRHLTDGEFAQEIRKQEEKKTQETADREKRQQARDAQQKAKDKLEEEWKRVVEKHKKAIEEWEELCRRLRGEGVRIKDLPSKPKRPLKATLQQAMHDDCVMEDGEVSSSEDGEEDEV